MVNLFEPGQEHYSINPAQHFQAHQEKMLDGEHHSANRRGEQMSKIKKPEGLTTPEASRVWDEYQAEMQMIQTLYIRIAMLHDESAFNHLNMFVTLCSAHAAAYLNAEPGTVQ